MYRRVRILAAALALALLPLGCAREEERTDRWVTTEDTNVALDWDKVNEAYRLADGPEDLERRVNEIYQGQEVISIAVHDLDAKNQEVTGFFDKNTSGSIDEGEKIFTIRREITGDGTAQVQTHGYGPYAAYHSPVMGIFTGMLLGSMMSRAFTPGYAPVYTRPYTTPPARTTALRQARNSYRAQNPSRAKPSRTGRTYNAPRSTPRPPRGGGRFGIRRGARTAPPARLVV